ncbi:hypothetical protein THRCLA_03961 [Thraustotheca clavata]|uniref:Transmembrane protein n=1 Tax=Thraustotheca clavata TaxID=74557 RepID=A0A1W0A0C1_9STRA|nr:hypothetical protein THRCLA_03961 [Thraustotheca clavata]
MIVPSGPPGDRVVLDRTHRRPAIILSGLLYLIFTSCLSVYFLYIIKPNIANDLWWRDFTTNGPQTYLADLYHRRLQLNRSNTINLFAPEVLLEKEYSQDSAAFVDMSLSLSRQVLLTNISLENAIQAMRQSNFEWNVRMFTQYCWVDWNKIYELSVTSKRQKRCLVNDADNAAVYWESLFRNSHRDGVFDSSYATSLGIGLFDTITTTTTGQKWLSSIWAHSWLSVNDEANVWISQGITRWQTELTNYYEQGLLQTIAVQNALGISQHVTVHVKAQAYRGLSVWTLVNTYMGVWNDLWEAQAYNCSLIRGANNYSDQMKLDWEIKSYALPLGTTLVDLVDASMGALGSIDVKYNPKPSVLENYYLAYHKYVVSSIWSDKSFTNTYSDILPLVGTVSPQKWRGVNITYFGGNPMCLSNRYLPFVQDQFGFYDSCSSQTESSMAISRYSMLFSLWTLQHLQKTPPSIESICQQMTSTEGYHKCLDTLTNLTGIVKTLVHSDDSDLNGANLDSAMQILNLTMIQFALNASKPTFLTQSVVAPGDPWSFFGWVMVYDWLQGDREVFRFETDQGTFVLITQYAEPTPFPANPLELPKQACAYIWIILVYSSVLLSFVALVVILAAILSRNQVHGNDLFLFHRIASIVWVGRPFLALRGFAAIILLSTSPLTFISKNGMSKFVFEPRSAIEIMVIASEATWITYVIVDLLLPITKDSAATYAPVSVVIAWLITFFTEFTSPFEATASVEQSCYVTQLGLSATCTGGTVQIGSPQRLILLSLVQLIAVFVSVVAVCIWKNATPPTDSTKNVYLPAAARYFLSASSSAQWYTNATIGLMSGIIPLGSSFFHVNLWQLIHFDEQSAKQLAWNVPTTAQPRVKSIGFALLGIVYVLFSVGGSITFIFVSETSMVNDFWWASFNSSGHQTFLANLFTSELQVSGANTAMDLTALRYADNSNKYNTTGTSSRVSTLYATVIQDEVNTLTNVVQSLRQMDGCQVPWIASHFCYVDFNHNWELGISAYRQKRCASYDINNGAVYLESYLRNVNWKEYDYCWHTSLEIGILSFLRTSAQGQQWIQSTIGNTLSVSDEVNHWNKKSITEFTTQWQNYKELGVLESFFIQNAFGLSYPITLKYSNGSMHTDMQTSFKMQWPLASQFWGVASNNSILSGTSLIRQSPRFAYANMTIFSALVDNQTVVTPLDIGFVIIQKTIGPFGEVTMRRISIPSTLVEWNKMIQVNVKQRMPTFDDKAMVKFSTVSGILSMVSAPKSWGDADYTGGDITCPTQLPAPYVCIYYSIQGACVINMEDSLDADGLGVSKALLALGPNFDITVACNDSTMHSTAQCVEYLVNTRDFISAAFTQAEWVSIAQLSEATINYFQTTQPLLVVQYIANATGTFLIQSNIFDPLDVGYHIFGWIYLLEWIQGVREVVQFEGMYGSSAIISGRNAIHTAPINSLEIPLNVAYYARCVLLYVTSVLFLVACIACYYIARSRAAIEGLNMFSINRVIGLVWIGRPLLFLRGITAICLLSTAKLDLNQSNGFFYMVSVPQSWFTTIMASGEITWLVFIINDSFSVLTKQYTPIYATQSSIVVWIAAAIWCLASPVQHQASVSRSCTVVAVDYQVVCKSGVVVIGDKMRFVGLIALALGLVLLCYIVQRIRFPNATENRVKSHLLYATALHHFRQDRWIYNNVYHIDRASAAIDGLVSYHLTNRQVIVLDIKTWRVFVKPLLPMSSDVDSHLLEAIPLS